MAPLEIFIRIGAALKNLNSQNRSLEIYDEYSCPRFFLAKPRYKVEKGLTCVALSPLSVNIGISNLQQVVKGSVAHKFLPARQGKNITRPFFTWHLVYRRVLSQTNSTM